MLLIVVVVLLLLIFRAGTRNLESRLLTPNALQHLRPLVPHRAVEQLRMWGWGAAGLRGRVARLDTSPSEDSALPPQEQRCTQQNPDPDKEKPRRRKRCAFLLPHTTNNELAFSFNKLLPLTRRRTGPIATGLRACQTAASKWRMPGASSPSPSFSSSSLSLLVPLPCPASRSTCACAQTAGFGLRTQPAAAQSAPSRFLRPAKLHC